MIDESSCHGSPFTKEQVLMPNSKYWLSSMGNVFDQFLTFDFQSVSKFSKIKLASSGSDFDVPKNFMVEIPSSATKTGKNCQWKSVASFTNTKKSANQNDFAEFRLPQQQCTRFVRLYFEDTKGGNFSYDHYVLVTRVIFE